MLVHCIPTSPTRNQENRWIETKQGGVLYTNSLIRSRFSYLRAMTPLHTLRRPATTFSTSTNGSWVRNSTSARWRQTWTMSNNYHYYCVICLVSRLFLPPLSLLLNRFFYPRLAVVPMTWSLPIPPMFFFSAPVCCNPFITSVIVSCGLSRLHPL